MEQNSIDARGARLALRMYIKWSWVAILALVAGFVLGSSLSSTTKVEGESTLVVGLTDEVRWPFFDAVLARQQGLIEDFELAEKTTEATGIQHLSVEVEAENTQNSTLTIAVRVDGNAEDAATYANELGQQLVQANADAQALSYVEEAQALQDQLDEQKALELGYETEIADLTADWVAIQDEIVVADPEDIAELRGEAIAVDRDRRVTERRLDGVIAFETSLISQLAQAERDASNSASTVEISRSAAAVSGSATDLGPVLAILNFLLALLLVPFLERALGRVSSLDQLALLFPDAKMIDNRFKDTGAVQPVDVVALSVKSLEARRHGTTLTESSYPPLVVAETGLSRATDEILKAVSVGGRRVSLVDLDTPAGLDAAVDADQVVLVVPARTLRVGRAKELASALTLLDASPEVVVLSKKAARGTSPREYGPQALPVASAQAQRTADALADDERTVADRRSGERPDVPAPTRRRKMISADDASERSIDQIDADSEDAELAELLGPKDTDASAPVVETNSAGASADSSVAAAATKRRAERATRRTASPDKAEAERAEKIKADADKVAKAKADAEKADKAKADAAEKAAKAKADADKAKAEKAKADADKAAKAKAGADKADADKAAKADADKAKAEKAKADADKAKAEKAKADADKAKADADKAKAEKAKADADKAEADEAKPRTARSSAAERRKTNSSRTASERRTSGAATRKTDDASVKTSTAKSGNDNSADDKAKSASSSTKVASDTSKTESTTSEANGESAASESRTAAKRRSRLPAKDSADETDGETGQKSTGKKTPAGSS